jgi:hypothetical protein
MLMTNQEAHSAISIKPITNCESRYQGLRILARMIARAYLKDTRIPPARFTNEQLPHFGNALASYKEKLKQGRTL